MPDEYLKKIAEIGASIIVKDSIINGEAGIGIWNITKQHFSVIEKMTNHKQNSYDSLADFLEQITHPIDAKMVLMDLETYLKDPISSYHSSFRLKGDKRQPKWVLLKGKKMQHPYTGEEIFYVLIYDVSGENFKIGNDVRTNLVNRTFFVKKMKGTLTLQKPSEKTAVIRLGINNYKNIKDSYGLQVVEELVKETASRLNHLFPKKAELSRFSNDTYVGMVPQVQNKQALQDLTEKIVTVFEEPFDLKNQLIRVKVSLGVTTLPDQGKTVEEILLNAEYATQKSRAQGDYVITFFNATLAEELRREIILENELPFAVEQDAFHVVYQPQINIQTGKVIGVEALARWQHPHLGWIPPDIFIGLAEKQGMMLPLGRSILKQSVQAAKKWQEQGLNFGNLSVNVSPMELMNPDYLPHLLEICETYDFSPEKLELEITEGIYLESIENSDQMIDALHNHGFCIAVDDFGTGYSNLSFIAHSNLDTVKIDKSLVDQLEEQTGYIVMKNIMEVAHKLDFAVIAEGVETKEQVRLLRLIHCENVQGFYYSRPLSAGEMEAFIKERN